jgi:peptide-methionine (S)-S-oxide reductase
MTTPKAKLVLLAGMALGGFALFSGLPRTVSAETMKMVPAPMLDETAADGATATAVFAGGCFWGVQGVYQHVDGVLNAVSGYSGGSKTNASYPLVSSGTTGHAESVKITYDPRKVTYGKLLQIYFSVVADPTTLNAQGPDSGTQYRTDIFTTTPKQAEIAKAYIDQLGSAHAFAQPIVTKVSAFKAFYPAEAYHQNYLTEHPHSPYIAINDMPKVEGLKSLFSGSYRDAPVLTAASVD